MTSARAASTAGGVRRAAGDEHRQPPRGVERAPDQQDVGARPAGPHAGSGSSASARPTTQPQTSWSLNPKAGKGSRGRADRPVGDPVIPGPGQPQAGDGREGQQAGVEDGHRVRHGGHLARTSRTIPATPVQRRPAFRSATPASSSSTAARSALQLESQAVHPDRERHGRAAGGGQRVGHPVRRAPQGQGQEAPGHQHRRGAGELGAQAPGLLEPERRPRERRRAARPTPAAWRAAIPGAARRGGRTGTSAGRAGGTPPGPGPGPSARPPAPPTRAGALSR